MRSRLMQYEWPGNVRQLENLIKRMVVLGSEMPIFNELQQPAAGVSFLRADGFDWHRLRIPILLLQYTEGPQDYAKAQILSPASMKTGNVFRP